MTSKRYIHTALVALAALALVLPLAAQEAAPALSIAEPVKDFGVVPKGETLEWAFVVTNSGKADLQILSASPACGCTVADFDKVIKPGATGKVKAVVDTAAFNGPIAKGITIQTNAPDAPTAQLTIKATVKPYVEAHPAGFVRYNLIQGDAQTQTVKIFSDEEQPFQIVATEVPGEHVKVTYKKIENEADRVQGGRAGQNQYEVNITVGGPTAPIGPLADKVLIRTNSKHQPEFPISISGIVRPTYSVAPTVLNFGEVTAVDPAAVRQVTLQSNVKEAGAPFSVTKVESSAPAAFTAEVAPAAAPGQFQVTVRIARDAKAGPIDGNIRIDTNDDVTPVYTLPVRGIVRAAE